MRGKNDQESKNGFKLRSKNDQQSKNGFLMRSKNDHQSKHDHQRTPKICTFVIDKPK